MGKVIAEDGSHRQHRQWLRNLLETTKGSVRVASAYITDRDLLLGAENRSVQVLTYLSCMDVISGATSLESLKSLVETGVNCRYLCDGPRLHAKVYIFGEQFAVITSANLTTSALDRNIEVGVQLTGSAVEELTIWFDAFWTKARPLNVGEVAKWQQQTDALRHDYKKLQQELRKKASALLPRGALMPRASHGELRDLLDHANRSFCCNTYRRHGAPTPTDGYDLEEKMRSRRFAAAWESFKYPGHMERVEPGDAIFMFAKGVGIIAVGCAQERCQKLEPGDHDRLQVEGKREWRVPVDWLDWRNDEDACSLRGKNDTFREVTEETDLRDAVRRHFLQSP